VGEKTGGGFCVWLESMRCEKISGDRGEKGTKKRQLTEAWGIGWSIVRQSENKRGEGGGEGIRVVGGVGGKKHPIRRTKKGAKKKRVKQTGAILVCIPRRQVPKHRPRIKKAQKESRDVGCVRSKKGGIKGGLVYVTGKEAE